MPTSSSNSPVLVFEPHWSVQRWLLVGAQAAICLIIPWLIPYWSVTVRVLLSLVALALLAVGYLRAGWWGSKRVSRITWQQSGVWLLQRCGENAAETTGWMLSGNSYIVSWLMILRWRSDAGTARLVILPGEMPTAAWHQWQMRLNLQGSPKLHSTSAEL